MSPRFQRRLMVWHRANRRAMPWRGVRDPYRIWLSEVMLQQTRVAAVVDYYRRFLRRFPSVQSLARAPQSEVLKHWAGLGYYSRARNLHRAAKEIVARYSGRFPRTIDAALKLPGVGSYTAAAVLSIAYGEPLAVLDGNVARVLARLDAIRGDLRRPHRWRQLQAIADRMMRDPVGSAHSRSKLRAARRRQAAALHSAAAPRNRAQAASLCYSPGDWNQAMMELGATVCTPRAPRCDACPVAGWCRARKLGIAGQLPAARRKRATERTHIAAAVLLDPRGRTLLVPPNGAAHDGLFSRMWQFPAAATAAATGNGSRPRGHGHLREVLASAKLPAPAHGAALHTALSDAAGFEALPPVRHTVTFRDVTLSPYLVRVRRLPRVAGARAPRLDELDSLAVSSATRKIARRALVHLAQQAHQHLRRPQA